MKKTHTILDQIVHDKFEELEKIKKSIPLEKLKVSLNQRQTKVRNFKQALSGVEQIRLIAEIKKASPSAGLLINDFNHLKIAKEYESSNKVDAISVITESKYFQGSINFIKGIKLQTTMPIFRKDFIFDEYQVYESYLAEADALLLIASMLETNKLQQLLQLSEKLGMQVLVETHNETEIDSALKAGASIIGINARDLKTFDIDLGLFEKLSKKIPSKIIKVAESGLETAEAVYRVQQAGADAILVGTSIMKAKNKKQKIEELLNFRKEK